MAMVTTAASSPRGGIKEVTAWSGVYRRTGNSFCPLGRLLAVWKDSADGGESLVSQPMHLNVSRDLLYLLGPGTAENMLEIQRINK